MAKAKHRSKGDRDDDIVIIKKYANRRLYDTDKSRYITLDDLGAMIREGREFTVEDAKSGDDITHSILTQIIMEEESRGPTMLPVKFLRQIIALYGDSVQSIVPNYLDATMDSFRDNRQRVGQAMSGALGGDALAEMTRRNMAMFKSAARAFGMPAIGGGAADEDADASDDKDAEIARLKAEIEALKKSSAAKK